MGKSLNGKELGNGISQRFQNLVFVTKNNQPTQQFLINECMQLVIQNMNKAGIDFSPFTLHTLRHTFATRAIECGMNPKTLQKLPSLTVGKIKMATNPVNMGSVAVFYFVTICAIL